VRAALESAFGAGANRLQRRAREALSEARVRPYANPRRIAAELGFRIRANTASDAPRAVVDDGLLLYRWDPSSREWGLNLFIALAMALLGELGRTATHGEVYALAGYLALPEDNYDTSGDVSRQQFLPAWFIADHHHYRAVGSASGVYRHVAKGLPSPIGCA
jgi:hypothetical protein